MRNGVQVGQQWGRKDPAHLYGANGRAGRPPGSCAWRGSAGAILRVADRPVGEGAQAKSNTADADLGKQAEGVVRVSKKELGKASGREEPRHDDVAPRPVDIGRGVT